MSIPMTDLSLSKLNNNDTRIPYYNDSSWIMLSLTMGRRTEQDVNVETF